MAVLVVANALVEAVERAVPPPSNTREPTLGSQTGALSSGASSGLKRALASRPSGRVIGSAVGCAGRRAPTPSWGAETGQAFSFCALMACPWRWARK